MVWDNRAKQLNQKVFQPGFFIAYISPPSSLVCYLDCTGHDVKGGKVLFHITWTWCVLHERVLFIFTPNARRHFETEPTTKMLNVFSTFSRGIIYDKPFPISLDLFRHSHNDVCHLVNMSVAVLPGIQAKFRVRFCSSCYSVNSGLVYAVMLKYLLAPVSQVPRLSGQFGCILSPRSDPPWLLWSVWSACLRWEVVGWGCVCSPRRRNVKRVYPLVSFWSALLFSLSVFVVCSPLPAEMSIWSQLLAQCATCRNLRGKLHVHAVLCVCVRLFCCMLCASGLLLVECALGGSWDKRISTEFMRLFFFFAFCAKTTGFKQEESKWHPVLFHMLSCYRRAFKACF